MTWWCVLACCVLAGCSSPGPDQRSAAESILRSRPLLGTFVVVHAYGPHRPALNEAANAAFAEIRRVEDLLTIHRTNSELARVNASAGGAAVPVSGELFAVLHSAQQIARETGGAFDVTIRPVADLWGFIWKQYRLPTAEELTNALRRVGYHHVELDAARGTVRLGAGVSIDPGGIGKGYAVDRAMQALREHGVSNALVRAGGDLRVMGAPPGQTAWPVQIEDPLKEGARATILLRDAAISTSGNYENYFVVQGTRYAHVLDPRTGLPVRGVASCSVIASTCMQSDAWATALMVLGPGASEEKFGDRWPMRFVVVDESGALRVRARGFPNPIKSIDR